MRISTLQYSTAWVFFQSALSARCNQVPFTASPERVLNPEFSNYVDHLMELWNVKGVSMAVIKPAGDVEFGSWGNRTEDGEPMSPETLFGIASCSKAFLSASLGVLFDDYAHGRNTTPLPDGLRKLDWETKIKDVLPNDEWKLQDEWATEKANFKDILSHLSGLPRHDASYGPADSPADNLHKLRYLRPAHELRQKFSYNNQMYVVGSHILSKYTGSHANYTAERIFKPLGMESTTYSPDVAAKSGKLTHTWTAHGQRIPYSILEEEKDLIAGPGGVISNVVDLSKWVKMLLHNGSATAMDGPGEPLVSVLPKSVFEAVTTSNTIGMGHPTAPEFSIVGYGLGWQRASYQGHDVLSHSGSIPGLTSHISFYPDDGFGIVTLLNTADKDRVALALHYRAAEDILGLPHKFSAEEPPTPPSPPGTPNTSTPLPLSAYSGLYSNPGYGVFVLCDPESTSHYCDSVLSDFRAVDAAQSLPFPPQTDVPQLFAAWPRIWSSHVRLVHAANNTNKFDISFTRLFPEGYGASDTAFEVYESDRYEGQVEFVVDEEGMSVIGFGYFGVGDMKGNREEGVSIEDGSIAWFTRV
ncbi:beta-lactamase/transpeptidase-like protein [Fomitiporia mediterranea MF3/22]|uniref:beta-lactamase/transpeptidase-like protein n=1 Tax=Fomitiporia mediterranea (strain MF3/22) TaxID=694068 RepID=UPI0004407A89|nr:beta-lactamase/transpeptidase-like protein [Fomitiporia mediterranea MF3/22]EJD02324.1 beta-lactamase/transpeptidase-like protein [Fomitiporia mediterranea MF3/22]